MPLPLHVAIVWLQRRLALSNSRRAWVERGAGLAVLAAGVAVAWLGGSLPAGARAALWAALVAGTAMLSRRGWVTLFGPVLFYDMVLTARRRRHAVLRCLYALAMVYVVVVVYLVVMTGDGMPREVAAHPFSVHRLPAHVIQYLNGRFFLWFACLQMAAALLLTPAYTAGAVAAERERQTLDALLGTDLRNREIVLSLLVSRLANLALILLTGLPILSMLEFVGGLDPNLVVASFAATGLTVASLGCLGIAQSVRSAKPRTAILRTYLWAVLYLAVSGLSSLLLLPMLNLASFPSTPTWPSPVTVEDAVGWLNAGNPVAAVVRLTHDLRAGKPLDKLLPDVLRSYAWFHGLVAATCLAWAVARFRACVLRDAPESVRGAGRESRRQSLPGLVEALFRGRGVAWPLLWKELIVDAGARRGFFGWLGAGLVVAVGVLPVVHLIFWRGGFALNETSWDGLREIINLWVRGTSGLIGSAMLVQVGVRAAGAVSGERARQTLDSLLTTPLEVGGILFAKWLGAVFNPRWSWVWLGLVWAVGLFTRSVHPVGILGFVVAWLVYAAFMAGLGLYFSGAGRTTQRATLWTLLAALGVLAASWLLAFDLSPTKYEAYGLIPPVALALLPTADVSFGDLAKAEFAKPLSIALGLVLWAALAVFPAMLAAHRFRFLTGRLHRRARRVGRAERGPPQAPANLSLSGEPSSPSPQFAVGLAPLDPPYAAGSPAGTAVPGAVPGLTPRTLRWFGRSEDVHRPSAPRARRRWRKRLRPLVPLLLPSALLFGWYGYDALSANRKFAQAVAEADALDPGWRLEELEARRRPVPDDRNSALRVEAADRLFPKPRTPSDWPLRRAEMVLSGSEPLPPVRLHEKQVQALTRDLSECRAALAEARRLSDYPDGFSPVVWNKDFITTLFPFLDRVRRVANLLGYEVMLQAHEEDPDGALLSCRALLHTSRSVGDMPVLLAQMTRDQIRARAVRRVERVLAQGEASEAGLAATQRVLEGEAEESLVLTAARADRAGMSGLIDAVQRGDVRLNQALVYWGVRGPAAGKFFGGDLGVLFTGNLTGQRAALLRYQNRVVETLKAPPETHGAGLAALAVGVAGEPLLVAACAPNFQFFSLTFRKTTAELRCAAVMVAAERFRRKYRRWPQTLDELVPEFLARVPLDNCNGQRLLLRRTPDGLVIYSVGSDGRDDGGKIDRTAGRLWGGTDWGVQLWDVNRRRQGPGVANFPVPPDLELRAPVPPGPQDTTIPP